MDAQSCQFKHESYLIRTLILPFIFYLNFFRILDLMPSSITSQDQAKLHPCLCFPAPCSPRLPLGERGGGSCLLCSCGFVSDQAKSMTARFFERWRAFCLGSVTTRTYSAARLSKSSLRALLLTLFIAYVVFLKAATR